MQLSADDTNPITWVPGGEDVNNLVSLDFKDENGETLQLDVTNPVKIRLPNKNPPPTTNVNMTLASDPVTGMIYLKVNVTSANMAILQEVSPPSDSFAFDVYLKALESPTQNSHIFHQLFVKNGTDKIKIFIPATVLTAAGVYFIGMKPVNGECGFITE
jgi:hypothetical protein